jgi:hypothetical protein
MTTSSPRPVSMVNGSPGEAPVSVLMGVTLAGRSTPLEVGLYAEAAGVSNSATPQTQTNQTDERRIEAIAALRPLRMTGALGAWRSSSPRALCPTEKREKRSACQSL